MANVYKSATQEVPGTGKSLSHVYKEQTFAGLTLPPSSLLKHDLAAVTNQMQLYFDTNGLFADPCLDRPVLNTTLLPMNSVGNSIPVRPSNFELTRWSFLTALGDTLVGARPDNPCDPSPVGGDQTACYMECTKGRDSVATKTGELDALVNLACRGVQDDLFFLGDVRGVSAVVGNDMLGNADYVRMGAVRRAMVDAGRRLQFDIMQQLWTGDPANDTANGGYKEFRGLLGQIADDYDVPANHPGLSGNNCDKLNSCVLDFGDNCIGGGTAIYPYLQAMEADLFAKAQMSGYNSVDWRVVMHRRHWEELVKVLPCEVMSDNCIAPTVQPGPGGNLAPIQISVDSNGQIMIRQQMQRDMTISINGRIYPVLLDDTLPITESAGTPGQYSGSIFIIPWAVNGTQTLYWEHKDYSAFERELSPLPGTWADMLGFSDGGRFHWVMKFNGRCFELDVKTELCLVFKAPNMAARLDNVLACPIGCVSFPDASQFQPIAVP